MITNRPQFQTEQGQAYLYTLKNAAGLEAEISTLGGCIAALRVPDREGQFADVVLGYPDCAGYQAHDGYFGMMIGRCCNRIARGQFTLNGKRYQLAVNNGRHHLHGGQRGLESKLWEARTEGDTLVLETACADGEEHYPGNLRVRVMVRLTEQNELELRYHAVSDADTLCNLTNHSYFNLAGHAAGNILAHRLRLYASRFTRADSESIPTGEILSVRGTPMDFLDPHPIGERISADYDQLNWAGGYDHNWVFDNPTGERKLGAELYDPASGRLMRLYTDSPCVQVYTGNGIRSVPGKEGCVYEENAGVALETQFAPDAVNHPEWARPILRAGEAYNAVTVFQFSTDV